MSPQSLSNCPKIGKKKTLWYIDIDIYIYIYIYINSVVGMGDLNYGHLPWKHQEVLVELQGPMIYNTLVI